jgi:putative Ca2+/H+ antiporter (TMEM165/GDT1 family)
MNSGSIILATFASVLLAEVAGDRSMYTVASLIAQFRPAAVLLGITAAYALKMLVAVIVADAVAHIASFALAAVSCLTWTITAGVCGGRNTGAERCRRASTVAR